MNKFPWQFEDTRTTANTAFPGGNALVLHAILGREQRTPRAFLQELADREQR